MKKIKQSRWKRNIVVGIFLTICALTACGEVTADHVLKKPQAVDYENMTLGEIMEAAIGCSKETSDDIAEIIKASGVTKITEIERYDFSTEDQIGSWVIDTNQTKIKLKFGKTEKDLNIVLLQWSDISLIGEENQELYFADATDFQLFGPDSEGLQLVIDDKTGTRAVTIQDKDFLQPWVKCEQGGQIYYLNQIKLYTFNNENKLTAVECPFTLTVNQDGETSLQINNKNVPTTDNFSRFGNGAKTRTIKTPNTNISE